MTFAVLWAGGMGNTAARAADFVYVVQPGDHLWNIAQRYLRQPAQALTLLRDHQIADERRLMPGTRLRIPQHWLRLQSAEVRLVQLAGEVTLEPSGLAGVRPARAGERLEAPALLRTGATGSASLRFSDGSQVLVLRDSELRVQASMTRVLDQASMVTLELLRGGLENQVLPRAPQGGRFEIHTPAAIAAVRGTRFRVHADGASVPQTRTEVLSGAVQVQSPGGQAMAQAAQGIVAPWRQSPHPPVPLLPAPDLSAVAPRVERLPLDLAFPTLEGASAYRVQIAAGPAFDVALIDETTPTPSLRLSAPADLPDGPYVLRVRGIDAQGLEGLSDERQLALQRTPEPPLLIDPAPGAITSAVRPSFRWAEVPGVRSYRLQLSLPGPFVPLVDQVVADAGTALGQDLPAGDYQWRVASMRGPHDQGPFSDAQRLRRALPGPDAPSAVAQDEAIVLRWSAQPGAARYRLQVARDEAFSELAVDLLTDEPQYTVRSLAPGLHHVRVQAIDGHGDAGPWGSAQTFTNAAPQASRWPLLWLLLPLVLL